MGKWFDLAALGSTPRREALGGLVTFLAMAYIAAVNPEILKAAGIDPGAGFVATCLAAAFGSILMGALANYPIALAPGMGLNAFFAFTVCGTLQFSAAQGLAAVFIAGMIFVVLSLTPVRAAIFTAIPHSLKSAIAGGIGLLLMMLGLQQAGVVVDHPVTLVGVGDLTAPKTLLACAGFLVAAGLMARKVPGALLIAVAGVAGIGWATGLAPAPQAIFTDPASLSTAFFHWDFAIPADKWGDFALVVFALLFTAIFDTAGTLIAVASRAGLLGPTGHLPRLGGALLSDSTAMAVGAAFGTSTTTAYIESAAGVEAGARSGLAAITVGLLFLAMLAVAPVFLAIPAFATAPALLAVGMLMLGESRHAKWSDPTEAAPAALALAGIPLTFSIAEGIGFAFVALVAVKSLAGRWREPGIVAWAIAGAFALYVALG